MIKKIFDNKIVSIGTSILEGIICVILILLIILAAFQRFSNQKNLFGYRVYTVASGSMIPTYNIGDTLLIKEMGASEINEGDAVTYLGQSGGVNGMIVTHQVMKKELGEDGKYYFHTKGIANNIEDPIISEDQVLGKVVHKFFFLSIIGIITTSMPLLFIFITIPLAILIAIEIIKIVYKKDEDDESEDNVDTDNEKDVIIEDEKVENKDDLKIVEEDSK